MPFLVLSFYMVSSTLSPSLSFVKSNPNVSAICWRFSASRAHSQGGLNYSDKTFWLFQYIVKMNVEGVGKIGSLRSGPSQHAPERHGRNALSREEWTKSYISAYSTNRISATVLIWRYLWGWSQAFLPVDKETMAPPLDPQTQGDWTDRISTSEEELGQCHSCHHSHLFHCEKPI